MYYIIVPACQPPDGVASRVEQRRTVTVTGAEYAGPGEVFMGMHKGRADGSSRGSSSGIDRRGFLKKSAALACGLPLLSLGFPLSSRAAGQAMARADVSGRRLVFIAIDGLNPGYLDLDADGMRSGKAAGRLMPNIRAFLDESVRFTGARCHLPSATDMNHLNALAGTSSAQTGIISVWAQPVRWDPGGGAVIRPTSLTYARDDMGRPVDTLFAAWKRRRPGSRTLFITGKEWVGEMFRSAGAASCVDLIVTGSRYPDYLEPPSREGFADPATDDDAACDPESGRLGFFGGSMNASDVMTRLYTGQGSLLTMQMEHFPNHFPHDRWIVDSTLEIFRRFDPGMAYILLAQCDDAGHCLGNAPEPDEFVDGGAGHVMPAGCVDKPGYRLVSSRNRLLFREPILDAVRDVDVQFGRLIRGLERLGVLDDAVVVLLSDHGSVNHLYTEDFSSTDFVGILREEGIVKSRGVLEEPDMYAFSVSSYGVMYWRGSQSLAGAAKRVLMSHRARNPQTGEMECPWWVLDRSDMKNGLDGVCRPGELYHTYYAEVDAGRTLMWPDLFVFARNGWQIPVYNGHVPNVGIKAPSWAPPWRVYNGGHGSVDTQPILAAVRAPGGKTGVNDRDVRISDLAVSAASIFGLELRSTTVGRDLSSDIL